MKNKFIKLVKDVLFVSKLTQTKKKKRKILFSIFLSNISTLIDILIILFFANIFQKNSELKILIFIENNLFILPLLIILRYLTLYFEKYIILKLQLEIEKNLKNYLMQEIFLKGNYSTSDAFFFVGQLPNHVAYFYKSLSTLVNVAVQATLYFGYVLLFQSELVIFVICLIFILFIPSKKLSVTLRVYVDKAYYKLKEVYDKIENLVENMYLIKILETYNTELKNFNNDTETYKKYKIKDFQLGTLNSILPPFLTLFLISLMYWFFQGFKFLTLDVIGVLLRLFQSLGDVNKNVGMLINSQVHLEKLYLVEVNKKVINKSNFKKANLNSKVAINFKNVSFSYIGSDKLVFENININFLKNKHTIITGENGSGKSTLIGLLSGVYYPSNGYVSTFSSKYSYVGPNPLIINSSLRENLLYGSSTKIKDSELINYLSKFKVFPSVTLEILNLQVSNKTLSSGQMQKIAFIRALIGKPKILILDEAFSNLDSSSKRIISEFLALKKLTIVNSTHSFEDFNFDHHYKVTLEEEVRVITEVK